MFTTNEQRLNELREMHTYGRPHGTWADNVFRQRYVLPLATLPHVHENVTDSYGNIHIYIGQTVMARTRIVWSCHTDTVHYKPCRQTVQVDAKGFLSLAGKSKKTSSCLGADDTVGVFICRQMVLAGIDGHYIFHYGEESGCIGSSAIAEESPEMLIGAEMAIAFDRGGVNDVITYQVGGRTASDRFARSFADQVNSYSPMLAFSPCDRGVYTDTNEYKDLVAECTNISVGYYGAHSPDERVDTGHVLRLLDAVIAMNCSKLVVARDPAVNDEYRGKVVQTTKLWDRWSDRWDDEDTPRVNGNRYDSSSTYLDAEYAEVVRMLTEDRRQRMRRY